MDAIPEPVEPGASAAATDVLDPAEGIHRCTESQSVGTQKVLRFGPMLGMSDEQYARLMTTSVRLMSRLGRK